MQRRIAESGLYFDPPQGYFRIEEAPYFRKMFKGRGLCEMDFGFWDPEQGVLNLIELKDYSIKDIPSNLSLDLAQKATDCLLLLASIFYELPHAEGIRGIFPAECHQRPTNPSALRLTFVIKTKGRDVAALLHAEMDLLRQRMAGRLEVLDLRSVTQVFLLDQWMAKDSGIPIDFEEEASGKTRKRR